MLNNCCAPAFFNTKVAMNHDNDAGDEEVMDIDDPRVPEEIRGHGMRFRKPARFVIDLGRGEYVLSAADGEVLDLVCLK